MILAALLLLMVAHGLATSKPCPKCGRPHVRRANEVHWWECVGMGACGTIWDVRTGRIVGRRVRDGGPREIVLYHEQ